MQTQPLHTSEAERLRYLFIGGATDPGPLRSCDPRYFANGGKPTPDAPIKQARTAIATIEEALAKLDGHASERAEAARAWLVGHRDALAAWVDAVESVGYDLTGPAFRALSERHEALAARRAQARRIYDLAGPDEVLAAQQQLERIAAEGRALAREVSALRDRCQRPEIPDLRALVRASEETRELANAARVPDRPARALHMALTQGARAAGDDGNGEALKSSAVARAWIIYEAAGAADDLFRWRWARYLEGGGAP